MSPTTKTCTTCGDALAPETVVCARCGAPTLFNRQVNPTVQPHPPTAPAARQVRSKHAPGAAFSEGHLIGEAGRYRIVRLLGRGGFGEAYLARDIRLQERLCVVKHLVFDPTWDAELRSTISASFAREAELLVRLNAPGHPHIPDIYDHIVDQHCLVMKYVEGTNLADLLNRRHDGLPEEEALRYVHAVCSALIYMHSRPSPVLHRDIKPENILLDSARRIWLIDFGLATFSLARSGLRRSRRTQAAGTLGFSPPEQWRGEAEPRSDVYALAMTLYILLTNTRLSRTQQLDLMCGANNALPPLQQLNPLIRSEVADLIALALDPEPAGRPSAQEFLDALQFLLSNVIVPPPPSELPPSEPLIGREQELAACAQLLATNHLVAITGLAGVGKTSLAAALARQQREPQKICWHRFYGGAGFDQLFWSIAAFLARRGKVETWTLLQRVRINGGQPFPPDLLLDSLVSQLAGQNYLIVLDDLQLVDEDPLFELFFERVQPLLGAGELALLMVTRRDPPLLAPGSVRPLHGLAVPGALQLLANYGVTLEAALAAQLIAATDGIPQLLILARDALRHSRPERLITCLTEADNIERFLLREVDAGLADQERAVLEAVAALLGSGGTWAVIEALLDQGRIRRTLSQLCRRHLLLVDAMAEEKVYRVHAIVQAFYYDNLGAASRRLLHERAGAFYEQIEPDPLRAAQHFWHAGQQARAADLVSGNIWPLISAGRARELRRILGQFSAAALDPERWAGVCTVDGEVAALLGEREAAEERFRCAIAHLALLVDAAGVRIRRARAYHGLGRLYEHAMPREALNWLQRGLDEIRGVSVAEEVLLRIGEGSVLIGTGDYQAAQDALETSLELLPAGASDQRGNALTNLGIVFCIRGDSKRGKAFYHQAIKNYQQTGNTWKLIALWHNLGTEDEIAGSWAAAAASYAQALELAEQLGHMVAQIGLALSMGILQLNQGQDALAYEHLQHGLVLARRFQTQEYTVGLLASLADMHVRQGNWETAAALVDEAEPLARQLDLTAQLPEILSLSALVRLGSAEPAVAYQLAQHAVALARQLGLDQELGVCQRVLGQAILAHGASGAEQAFAQSLELCADNPYELARTQMIWGQALLNKGEHVQARRLLQAAGAAFHRLGARRDMQELGRILGEPGR